jgi:hypothetical protein
VLQKTKKQNKKRLHRVALPRGAAVLFYNQLSLFKKKP